MPRFATPEQISLVAGLAPEIASYKALTNGLVKEVAGLIEAYSPDTGLEIRYITGEGRDDEKWRGALVAVSPGYNVANCWCITVTLSSSFPLSDMAVGENKRSFGLGVDYYLDYDFGTDANNSESKFNALVDGFEALLDNLRTCFDNGATLEAWVFRRMIKRFTDATTHIAKGDLSFTLEF